MVDQADGAGSGEDELWPRVRLLERWIERAVTGEALGWFRQTVNGLGENSPAALTRALALAPRWLGKADLPLATADFRLADEMRAGLDPTGLSADQAGRAAFLLASYRDAASFSHTLKSLTRTADLAELVAF